MGVSYSLMDGGHGGWIAPAAAGIAVGVTVGCRYKNSASLSLQSRPLLAKLSQWTEKAAMHVLTKHRSLVVVTFGLPLSFAWDVCMGVRATWVRYTKSAPSQHKARVADIVAQVISRPPHTPMCTSRPGWMSISLSFRPYKDKWNAIRMHNLIDVLDVNVDDRVVHVEPFVTIGQLTRTLLPLGLTLPVVPEMDDLTVGGLLNGTGIESSSHRYGLFHEMVEEYELCLGDGTVVIAKADNEYSDLYHAIPWSYGTLALLLSAKLRLVPSKSHVKLTYTPHVKRDSYLQHFSQLCHQDNGSTTAMFVEGLVFSRNEAVIMSGELVDASEVEPSKVNGIGWWWKPWFYKHVQSFLGEATLKCQEDEKCSTSNGSSGSNHAGVVVEYIPLRQYYHRHSQSLFWEMELMIPIGNNPIFRWTLGWLMPPKVSFLKITQTEWTRQLTERTHVAQDFLLPLANMGAFLETCDDEFDGIYPLWLCPHSHKCMPGSLLKDPPAALSAPASLKCHASSSSTNGTSSQLSQQSKSCMYVDVGVYGLPQCVKEGREEEFDMVASTRKVLHELQTLDGFQMLYGDVYSTREEFEQMYDHDEYRKLRQKYGATECFKEVYDKMNVCL